MFLLYMVLGLFYSLVKQSEAQTRSDFIEALIVDYDNRIPPNFEKNNYTEVDVSLFINSIDSISEQRMDYTMNMFIQQEWYDPRLQFFGLIDSTYLELDARLIKDVWVPDLYFTNEKKASFHDVTVPNLMMHLYEDGRIVYRLRKGNTIDNRISKAAVIEWSKKTDHIDREFAYTMSRLRFKWKQQSPVRTNVNLQLPQFHLDNHFVSDCTGFGDDDLSANFTCIRLDLHLTRSIGFYMIQVYIPTMLIVLLSWVSFWLSIDAVPARISLGILTVLTITTQRTQSVASVPPVSYVKALDVWMAICLLFVFAALLEYPVVYVMERRDIKRLQTKVSSADEEKALNPMKTQRVRERLGRNQAMRIDSISKVVFPLVFSSFMAVYWVAYTL